MIARPRLPAPSVELVQMQRRLAHQQRQRSPPPWKLHINARLVRSLLKQLAMADNVLMLLATTIPSVAKLPLAIAAPMSRCR